MRDRKKAKPTLFRITADNHFVDQRKGSMVGMSIAFLVIGVIIAIFFPIVAVFLGKGFATGFKVVLVRDYPNLATIIWFIVATLCILVPFCMLMYYLFRPTKKIICPKCHHLQAVYKSTTTYMCSRCSSLMLLEKFSNPPLTLSVCEYCKLQTSITNRQVRFICPNCACKCGELEAQTIDETTSCLNCEYNIPQSAIFCIQCKTIARDIFENMTLAVKGTSGITNLQGGYDLTWKVGKDWFGHLQYAKAVLHSINKRVDQASDLHSIDLLLKLIEESLISIEEALASAETSASIHNLIPHVDEAYGRILLKELEIINQAGLDKEYSQNSLQVLIFEPHIKIRRRVEELLGEHFEAISNFGKWQDKLVILLIYKRTIGLREEKYMKIKDTDKLKAEVKRIKSYQENNSRKL